MSSILLSQYLNALYTSLDPGREKTSFLRLDFQIVREYVLDILKRDKSLRVCLDNRDNQKENSLGTSIVLDLSSLHLNPIMSVSHVKGTINVKHLTRRPSHLPPFTCFNNRCLNGQEIMRYIHQVLKDGLAHSGYFVRGHQADIYELELCEMKLDQKKQLITISAASDNTTMLIDFRILIKFSDGKTPGVHPYPEHALKKNWLAIADGTDCYSFHICAPHAEFELSQRQPLTMAFRVVLHLLNKMSGCNWNEILLSSVVHEIVIIHGIAWSKQLVDTLTYILRKMLIKIKRNIFHFYWNLKVDLINNIPYTSKRLYLQQLSSLVKSFERIKMSTNMTLLDFQDFFKIEVEPDTYKIDTFGVYKSF